MASAAESILQLPGYGLPVNHMPHPDERFPTITGHQEDVWRAATLVIREVCMLRFQEEITNKDNWWAKIRDADIAKRWKTEALELDWAAYRRFADFTPAMADTCITELRHKAELYEKTGLVPVIDYSMCAIKSDSLMPASIQKALKDAVAILEDVSEMDKDWHPGSDGKVLDLVHPSMWPLVYGRSRILPNTRIGVVDNLQSCGMGDVIPEPERKQTKHGEYRYSSSYLDNSFSTTFQWLPCDVSIDQTGHAKVMSYINSLHPIKHASLYPIIEKFIEKALPAWDIVVRWPQEFELQRLTTDECGTTCKTPEICGDSWSCSQTSRPLNEEEEEREEDEAWEPWYAQSERETLDRSWFDATHPMILPDIDPDTYEYQGPKPEDVKSSGFFGGKTRIQVIVKLANIHLTPEQPSYDGGSWHVEGQINEHICATALFYYDSDNITDSHLGFRTIADSEGLSENLRYEQSDFDSINRTFAIDAEGSSVQELGSVLTREGRALFFPNVYQHRVSPFTLADPTRPGHRKILALFLVDPSIPVISTANVPPQRKDWWLDVTRLHSSSTSRLPAELTQMIADSVDFPIGVAEAKRLRDELMAERSSLHSKAERAMESWEWNFCEH